MAILITGSSGMVGSALRADLESEGREVVPLRRGEPEAGTATWEPMAGRIDAGALEGLEGVVHLAGENIASGRWTAERKRRILESRVEGTGLLARTLAGLEAPPPVLVSASAIGYYGDRGDELLDEESAPGEGFLAEVCRGWEAAAEPARAAGLRVVRLRIGVVLARGGGALEKMLTPFRLGLGGVVGSGRQYVSWISLPDLVRAIRFCLGEEALAGAVNAVAPEPVTQAELTRALGAALGRPTVVPMPGWAARLALGEMAEELLLASTRVASRRLAEAGFRFRLETVEKALEEILGG